MDSEFCFSDICGLEPCERNHWLVLHFTVCTFSVLA